MSHDAESHGPPAFRHAGFAGHIGVARVDITPPAGIYCRNWGAARHDAAEGIHRPLTLTALALKSAQQAQPLVYVEADATWFRSVEFGRKFRQRLLQELNIDSARFVFALTHTHAAVPLTDECDPSWEGGQLLAEYPQQVFQATNDAVTKAVETSQPATLTWHTGRCGLAAVRDLIDPDSARPRRLCGFDPTVKADDTLLVGRVSNTAGDVLATLCNYACHPTTLAWENRLISPDFVGALRETVERETDGACALFMQAASGDLAPRLQYVGDTAVADRHGRQLGYAVLATLADMEPAGQQLGFSGAVESGAPLATWVHRPHDAERTLRAHEIDVELPLQDWPTAEELERQRLATDDRVLQERLRRKRDLRLSLGDTSSFRLPVWIWQIGDVLLVGNMAEAYSWIQRRLRDAFPHLTIVYQNLVNGSIGYLPTATRYDEDVYQVWQTPFGRGSLEHLEAEIESVIARITKTEPVP